MKETPRRLRRAIEIYSKNLLDRVKRVEVLLMDVDGTLTRRDITLLSMADGSALEIKTFDAHDRQGLCLARAGGIRTGIISGRESAALRRHCEELCLDFVYERQAHKVAAYEDILKRAQVGECCVAYLGDDLPDLPVMRRVGFSAAVSDAVPEVKRGAHYVTKAFGGAGAARELVELILKSKGVWEDMIDRARA